VLAVIVAMLQEDGGDGRVMLQNPNEFRAAIPAMSDNADLECQLIDYTFL
jgi:hypothetical protein